MTDDPIISTSAHAGEYDAMVTAKPNEPVLTLQGGDPFAAPTVQFWVGLAREAALQIENPEEREKMLRKATSAEAVAWAMRDYFNGERIEAAPVVEDGPAEITSDRTIALVRTVRRIHNAVAEVAEAAEALENLGEFPTIAKSLRDAVLPLQGCANVIEPRQLMRRKG